MIRRFASWVLREDRRAFETFLTDVVDRSYNRGYAAGGRDASRMSRRILDAPVEVAPHVFVNESGKALRAVPDQERSA